MQRSQNHDLRNNNLDRNKEMEDLINALKITDEVFSGRESKLADVKIKYEETAEKCTLYVVDMLFDNEGETLMVGGCDNVAVVLWNDGTIVTQRDWQPPTRIKSIADIYETKYNDWMSPQGEIVMLPDEKGGDMPSVLYC